MRNAKPRIVSSSTASGEEGMEEVLPRRAHECSAVKGVLPEVRRRLATVVAALRYGFSSSRTGAGAGDALLGVPRWKRILDLTCVLISAPCWLTTMTFVGLWIKAVSPGPIFYRQERIGLGGRRFMILKFRSMRVNVDTRVHEEHLTNLIRANCPMRKLDSTGDPRLIPGGRFLRALGLDEVPQILNVIRSEMSLVGPRPCTPHEFQHYQPWQQARVNALPGLTGVWQVSGKNRTTFDEMIQMDLFYAKNMSPWLDLRVILMTVPAVLSQLIESRASQVEKRRNRSRVVLEQPAVE